MNHASVGETIVHEITIRAGADRVFAALTSPEQRTTVRLTHSGLTTESARAQNRGWPDILAWLQAYAERHDRHT